MIDSGGLWNHGIVMRSSRRGGDLREKAFELVVRSPRRDLELRQRCEIFGLRDRDAGRPIADCPYKLAPHHVNVVQSSPDRGVSGGRRVRLAGLPVFGVGPGLMGAEIAKEWVHSE